MLSRAWMTTSNKTVSDAIATALSLQDSYRSYNKTKVEIRNTFQSLYPVWNFNDWDKELHNSEYHMLVKELMRRNLRSINQIIVDLPSILAQLKSGHV